MIEIRERNQPESPRHRRRVEHNQSAALSVLGIDLAKRGEVAEAERILRRIPKRELEDASPLHAELAIAEARTFDPLAEPDIKQARLRQIVDHVYNARKGIAPTSDNIDARSMIFPPFANMFRDTVSILLAKGVHPQDASIESIENMVAQTVDKMKPVIYTIIRHPEEYPELGDSYIEALLKILGDVRMSRGDRKGALDAAAELETVYLDIHAAGIERARAYHESQNLVTENLVTEHEYKVYNAFQVKIANAMKNLSEMYVAYGSPERAITFFLRSEFNNWEVTNFKGTFLLSSEIISALEVLQQHYQGVNNTDMVKALTARINSLRRAEEEFDAKRRKKIEEEETDEEYEYEEE